MADLSNYVIQQLLLHTVGKSTYGLPTTYVALYTTTPSAVATDGVEVTGGSYARIATPPSSWNNPVVGSTVTISNAVDLVFPTASAAWGTVNGAGILDASTAGNLLWFGPLTTAKVVNNGDTFKLLAGSITLSMS